MGLWRYKMLLEIKSMKIKADVDGLYALLLKTDESSEKGWIARLDIAEALAQLGDRRGQDYLNQMAESSNKDIREVALEILEGLKNYQPEPITHQDNSIQTQHQGLLYKINSKYPFLIAWVVFLVIYFIAITALNPVVTLFLVTTYTWLPELASSLILFSVFISVGFFVFRFVVKKFIMPYEK
jgi:HEAT repeat protein